LLLNDSTYPFSQAVSWGNAVTFTALIWIFLPFYMRGNVSTMPEFLEKRFNKTCRYIYATVMIINDGDRLERLTCYSTMPNRTAPLFYAEHFGEEEAAKMNWTLGEMTTCLIKTALGKVVKMDLDIQSNRPHSFDYLLQGTIDSRGGLGYIVSGWYIFVPPGGTLLLRRLHLDVRILLSILKKV